MKKFKRSLLFGICVITFISATACSSKNKSDSIESESTEIESVQSDNVENDNGQNNTENDTQNKFKGNVKVGISSHVLIAEIPADIDYGTGEFADNIINYQRVGQVYYIGPKDYLALGEDKFVIYDRGGEQVAWITPEENKFYSVDGLNVEGLYNDGEDVLLKCSDSIYFPIKEDGTISESPKKDVKINSIATDELEKMVQGDDKYVSVIRVDEDGNFYTHEEVFLPKYDVAYFEHRICKYDKDGKLLGYSLYYPDDFVAEPDHPVIVLEDGSVYRMVCEQKEIKIYKVTLGTSDYYRLEDKVKAYIYKMNLEDKNLPSVDYSVAGNTHEAIRDVLIREKEFIDTDNGGKRTVLSSFCLADGTDYDEKYFSVADTDKDGYYEVFVRQHSDLYVVFKYIDGEVYSYQIPSGKFLNDDGIMFDKDVYFVPIFTVEGYTRFQLAHSEKTDNGDKFYIGDELVEYKDYIRFTGATDNWKIAKKYYGTVYLDSFARIEKYYEENGWRPKYATDSTDGSVVPKEIVDVLLYDKEFTRRWDYYDDEEGKVIKNVKKKKMSDFTPYYSTDSDEDEDIFIVQEYTVVDFDHDGYSEVVVRLNSKPVDVIIVFHSENGVVYGYVYEEREVEYIAPNGYLYQNNGSLYTITFNKDEYIHKEICGIESDGTYYVGGVQVTEEEYIKIYDEVWGSGQLQEYDSLLMLLNLTNTK